MIALDLVPTVCIDLAGRLGLVLCPGIAQAEAIGPVHCIGRLAAGELRFDRLAHAGVNLQRQVWRWTPLPIALRDSGVDRPMTISSADGPLKIIRIVLTIAHLDHQPENCAPSNLRALCQRHHLAYDRDHHCANAQATRRAKSGTLELF